jgi:hypothetical protein
MCANGEGGRVFQGGLLYQVGEVCWFGVWLELLWYSLVVFDGIYYLEVPRRIDGYIVLISHHLHTFRLYQG